MIDKLNAELLEAVELSLMLAEEIQEKSKTSDHLDITRLKEAREVVVARSQYLQRQAEIKLANKAAAKGKTGKEAEKDKAPAEVKPETPAPGETAPPAQPEAVAETVVETQTAEGAANPQQ